MNFVSRAAWRRLAYSIAFFSAAFATAPAVAQALPQAIVVPGFFGLNQTADWDNLLAAGALAKVVVVNDTFIDGTLLGPSGTCEASAEAMIGCLHKKGVIVLGYVAANFGARAENFILNGGDGGLSVNTTWYLRFGDTIDGIFVDNGPADTDTTDATRRFFLKLFLDIKNQRQTGRCGNKPCVMVNASQFFSDWVVNQPPDIPVTSGVSADWAVMYERPVHGKDNQTICGGGSAPDGQDFFGLNDANAQPAPGVQNLGFCPNSSLPGQPVGNCAAPSNQTSPPNWFFATPQNAAMTGATPNLSKKSAFVLREPDLINGQPTDQPGGTHQLDHAGIDTIVTKTKNNYNFTHFLYVHDQGCDSTGRNRGAVYERLSFYFPFLVDDLGADLTVTVTGGGEVKSTDPGVIDCVPNDTLGQCQNTVSNNDSIELQAIPNPQQNFAGFVVNGSTAACGSSNPCSIPINGTTSVSASFSAAGGSTGTVNLTKSGDGDGLVTTTPAGINCAAGCGSQSAAVAAGQVTLNATPDSASLLDHLEIPGNLNCTSNCTFTLAANGTAAVKAVFIHPALSVVLAGSGSGTVTSQPAGINCPGTCNADFPREQVTLTATAANDGHSIFAGWSGGGCSGTGTCVVNLQAATQVTATFGTSTALSLHITGNVPAATGSVTVTPGGFTCGGGTCSNSYASGSVLTLTATPSAGVNFTGFTGGGCTGNPCTLTLNQATLVTAKFFKLGGQ
jgi:hypothetical protein